MPRTDDKQKALFEAVSAGNVEDVRKLLAAGADPNVVGGRKTLFWNRTLMEGTVLLR